MLLKTLTRSFVIKSFRDFHQEVLVAKAMALSGQEVDLTEENTKAVAIVNVEENDDQKVDDAIPEQMLSFTSKISSKLELMLKNQMNFAISYGGDFAAKYYLEAQYLMAAYADEVFLNLNWAGRKEWESNLLESRMYNTHVAGEEFFTRLDHYLTNRDPSTRDIGAIYLWMLGLGFRGKYRNVDDAGSIATYRRRLYEFVLLEKPDLINETPLFPQAYQHTLDEGILTKLPNPRTYNFTFLGVLVAFFIGSFLVWYKEIAPINHAMNEIIQAEKGL